MGITGQDIVQETRLESPEMHVKELMVSVFVCVCICCVCSIVCVLCLPGPSEGRKPIYIFSHPDPPPFAHATT